MDTVPTVKVKSGDNDYAIINESDFDEKVHELYEPEAPKEVVSRKKAKSK